MSFDVIAGHPIDRCCTFNFRRDDDNSSEAAEIADLEALGPMLEQPVPTEPKPIEKGRLARFFEWLASIFTWESKPLKVTDEAGDNGTLDAIEGLVDKLGITNKPPVVMTPIWNHAEKRWEMVQYDPAEDRDLKQIIEDKRILGQPIDSK